MSDNARYPNSSLKVAHSAYTDLVAIDLSFFACVIDVD